MLYCCEECGKKYTTENEAIKCEKVHAEEKIRKEEFEKTKNESLTVIQSIADSLNEKIKTYYNDYGEYPDATIKYGRAYIPSSFWVFRESLCK